MGVLYTLLTIYVIVIADSALAGIITTNIQTFLLNTLIFLFLCIIGLFTLDKIMGVETQIITYLATTAPFGFMLFIATSQIKEEYFLLLLIIVFIICNVIAIIVYRMIYMKQKNMQIERELYHFQDIQFWNLFPLTFLIFLIFSIRFLCAFFNIVFVGFLEWITVWQCIFIFFCRRQFKCNK